MLLLEFTYLLTKDTAGECRAGSLTVDLMPTSCVVRILGSDVVHCDVIPSGSLPPPVSTVAGPWCPPCRTGHTAGRVLGRWALSALQWDLSGLSCCLPEPKPLFQLVPSVVNGPHLEIS